MAGIRLSVIAFRPVVRLAQHLTVLLACGAAATPCGHMVGVHLGFLVNAFRVRIMPNGAQRAIRDALGFGRLGLTPIDNLGRLLVEDTDMQQTGILFAAEDIFDDAATIRHTGIVQQLFQTFIHSGFRVRIRMVHAIQPTPFLSAYLRPRVLENGIRPVKPDGKRKPATQKERRVVLCRSIACRHTGAT